MRPLFFSLPLLAAPLIATAQMPPQSLHYRERETVTVNTMLCDTVDQLESIVRAQVEGGVAAGQQAYLALFATPNALQEPSCLVATYKVTLLDVASVMEDVPTADGTRITLYVLYVVAGGRPFAILSPIPVGHPELDV